MIKVKECVCVCVCVCPLFPYYQVILSDTLTLSFDILRFKKLS